MNFVTHRIIDPTGDKKSDFSEWLSNFVKTASEAKPEDDDSRGAGRGQVINNDNEDGSHSYQEGESVDGKPDQKEGKSDKKEAEADIPDIVEAENDDSITKEADCGKEMGSCGNAGKVTEEHTDAESTEAGAPSDTSSTTKQRINNDPNYQKGESTNPGKVDGKNKKESSVEIGTHGFKKVASLNRVEKLELFAHILPQKKWPLPYVEAMLGVKWSNLTDKEKEKLMRFWRTQYDEDYVQEMVADR